ncbi:MAG TPA: hypothetical protein VFQ35_13455, partial [Polyangiaceae bacterium]|nr:hypothetical protein [Polyangiaceae bacterium]
MSKKNIARTALEGGRRYYNCWYRRRTNAVVRAEERTAFSRLRDREDVDDILWPKREPVYQDFYDKLAPVFRWLKAQAGRPWSKVRSELTQRFDTRTTAGRHIIFCHVLPAVDPVPRFSRYHPVYVDRYGILRLVRPKKRKGVRAKVHWLSPSTTQWLEGRRIAQRGELLYWFVPTESGAFRQANRLNDAEAEQFREIPE